MRYADKTAESALYGPYVVREQRLMTTVYDHGKKREGLPAIATVRLVDGWPGWVGHQATADKCKLCVFLVDGSFCRRSDHGHVQFTKPRPNDLHRMTLGSDTNKGQNVLTIPLLYTA